MKSEQKICTNSLSLAGGLCNHDVRARCHAVMMRPARPVSAGGWAEKKEGRGASPGKRCATSPAAPTTRRTSATCRGYPSAAPPRHCHPRRALPQRSVHRSAGPDPAAGRPVNPPTEFRIRWEQDGVERGMRAVADLADRTITVEPPGADPVVVDVTGSRALSMLLSHLVFVVLRPSGPYLGIEARCDGRWVDLRVGSGPRRGAGTAACRSGWCRRPAIGPGCTSGRAAASRAGTPRPACGSPRSPSRPTPSRRPVRPCQAPLAATEPPDDAEPRNRAA